MYPTAARTTAAICLAILGWILSDQVRLLFPEGKAFGVFNQVNAGIGFLCGWFIVGTRAGQGYGHGVSHGLTGAASLVFWGLFIQAANEMTRLAMRHRYDGPLEAMAAVFEIGVEFGQMMLVQNILMTVFFGGIITGWLTEYVGRRFK